MAGFFAFLFLASLGSFIASMAKPSLFAKMLVSSRKAGAKVFGGLTVLSFVLMGLTGPHTEVKGVAVNITPTLAHSTSSGPTAIPTATPTLTPTPIPTKVPTVVPTKKPVYVPPTTYQYPTQPPTTTQNSGLSTDNYYTNVDGTQVHSPAYSNTVPAGATAVCGDGTYSFSFHRSGTCSHHGGAAQWL